jgi:hypothetical protein
MMGGDGRFWMIPPTTLLASPGRADGGGSAMVGSPGGSPNGGGGAASARATTGPASLFTAAAPPSARGAPVLMSGMFADGGGTGGVIAAGPVVVAGGATTAGVALGAGAASSFLLHPNDERAMGRADAVTTATMSEAVFMTCESIPRAFRSARLSRYPRSSGGIEPARSRRPPTRDSQPFCGFNTAISFLVSIASRCWQTWGMRRKVLETTPRHGERFR